jgi:regulator of replication initiation timing
MKTKLQKNVFYAINDLSNTVVDLQRQIIELNQKLENYQDIGRSHLLRVKNGDQLSDDYILNGRKYNDMSPESA